MNVLWIWFPDKSSASAAATESSKMKLNTSDIVVSHIGFLFDNILIYKFRISG